MNENLKHRLGGLLCIAISIAFGWWGIWQPYEEALAGAPQIRFQIKAFVLVPAALVFGIFFVLFGNAVAYRDPVAKKPTRAGIVLLGVAAAGAIGGFFAFQQATAGLGYR